MRADTFQLKVEDGKEIFVYRFQPDEGQKPKAIVHVAHGMAEHGARYARFAEALTAKGYVVYANDHRGHGKTANGDGELGYFADARGFSRAVQDLQQLVVHEKGQHPGLPLFLFGHSMGSFLTQAFLVEFGSSVRGAILSGSNGKPNALAQAGRVVARLERARLGPKGKSRLLTSLSFDDFNKAFKPNRTSFDWLSRDEAEVDKYIADPLCGFMVTTQLWVDLLDGTAEMSDPAGQALIPKDLPIYIFAGSEDPVGGKTRGLQQLVAAYRAAGIKDVSHKFYPGGRHEMLNETNRDEVTRDVIAWLDAHAG
ncbi:Lysophospholipase [Minicystis rosea]|nr:Lysophospholipase [Minicystis rosea]